MKNKLTYLYILAMALTLALFGAPHAVAAPYDIDYAASTISFSGEHAGTAFTGTFQEWSGVIDFDAAAPQNSTIHAEFNLGSAHIGNKMYDGTLPQSDWFAVKDHPTGLFGLDTIAHMGGDTYRAAGSLTLRGVEHPVAFDFVLTQTPDGHATAKAEFPIDRLAYGIGQKSDPKAEWVSQNITIHLDIRASLRP